MPSNEQSLVWLKPNSISYDETGGARSPNRHTACGSSRKTISAQQHPCTSTRALIKAQKIRAPAVNNIDWHIGRTTTATRVANVDIVIAGDIEVRCVFDRFGSLSCIAIMEVVCSDVTRRCGSCGP